MLRELGREDMRNVAALHRQSRLHAMPWLRPLHTPEEDLRFFTDVVFGASRMWGYFDATGLAGFIAFHDGWIDHLYVLPSAQRRGVGSTLLEVAQREMSSARLWTFQRNLPARTFYERRGFTLVDKTDGSQNEEREPDALYEW